MSIFLIFLVLSRSCFSALVVQKNYKKVLQKSLVEKLCKKIDKKPKTDFSRICFNQVFGRFSVRGVQKHDKKTLGK
jgi:hypothetical protein